MNCEEARELFSDHLEDALEPSLEDELDRHLATCSACREALRDYQAPLEALADAAPEPPADLPDRIARLLPAEPSPWRIRIGWFHPLPLAAALALLLIGYGLGGGPGPSVRPAPPEPVPLSGCADELVHRGFLDPSALRISSAGEPEPVLTTGGRRVILPASLRSHGPYDPRVEQALHRPRAACLPLTAPYGDVLVLSLSRPGEAGLREGAFRVEPDPRRVLYTRIHWLQEGLVWTLEGRAAPPELLDLATEIATGSRVERV